MPCPYFHPSAPQSSLFDPRAAMLPLGGHWSGVCRSVPEPEPASQPNAATLRSLCNLGYARGACSRFPEGDGPDAVRFTISGDDGATLRLYYVVERNHHPFAHGPLTYSRALAAFTDPPANQTLGVQAQAYVESYLRRKSGASCGTAASTEHDRR
jgi:hypothetical protein